MAISVEGNELLEVSEYGKIEDYVVIDIEGQICSAGVFKEYVSQIGLQGKVYSIYSKKSIMKLK